ncbi:PIG-L family deacetylase, partial [Thermococci archaeon]
MFSRILVLSPHTDDGEIGAGGTIARFVEEGKEIYYVAFSSCEASVPKGFPEDVLKIECKKATSILGINPENVILLEYEVRTFPLHRQEILDDMIALNRQIKPELVLVPSSNDIHQDHQVIYAEALRAFKKNASIWGYEHPWNNLT